MKRVIAGVFVGGVLTLGMAGPAFGQSPSPSPSPNPTAPPTTGGFTPTTVAARGTLGGRTGTELWIPLTIGGGTAILALGARRVLGRVP